MGVFTFCYEFVLLIQRRVKRGFFFGDAAGLEKLIANPLRFTICIAYGDYFFFFGKWAKIARWVSVNVKREIHIPVA